VIVRVRFFAAAADAAGRREWVGEVPAGATAGSAVAGLAAGSPRLADLLPRCLLAVDREYVNPGTPLHDGAEVAVIPPVSGGSSEPLCRIAAEPISADALVAHVAHEGAGGVVVFYGSVRGRTGEDRTVRLEYDAYPEMAEAKLREIAAEAARRWPGTRLALVHRVGTLGPGEVSVVVAASAPHRDAAFEAARFAIDRIKTVVPIWKKEVLADGREFWVDHA
jgi:molybdopterin synthase catalytic subunit/molybdopterin converting factor small subunit